MLLLIMNRPHIFNKELTQLLEQAIDHQIRCSNCEIFAFISHRKKTSEVELIDKKRRWNIKDLTVLAFFITAFIFFIA